MKESPSPQESDNVDPSVWLREESEEWARAGLISARQRARIGARYGLEIEIPEPPQFGALLSIRSLVAVAAIALLSVGILLVVASNWNLLSYWQRVGLVGGTALIASVAATLIDRPGRRHLVSQVLDIAAVAGIVGVAAVTSQHLQESTADWLKNLAMALIPAALYAEARRNDAVASIVWSSFAGVGIGWLGQVVEPDRLGGVEISAWSGFAAGLALAVRARGWWTPLFAVAAGGMLAVGLIVAVTLPRNIEVLALTGAGVTGGLVGVTLLAIRLWFRPGPAWTLALLATVASAVALLWANIWTRLVDFDGLAVEAALVEANAWVTASLTAIAVVTVLGLAERARGRGPIAREVVRWVIYAFAAVSAFVHGILATNYELYPSRLPSWDGYSDQAAIANGAVLVSGALLIAAAWLIVDRFLVTDATDGSTSRFRRLLTPGAALAAGGILSTLWIPAARLIGQADQAMGIETVIAWLVGAGGAVWVVAILAERARQLEGRAARAAWIFAGVVGIGLAIMLFVQPQDLLVRGLTFAAIAGLLLAALGRQWVRPRAQESGASDRPAGTSASGPSSGSEESHVNVERNGD